MLKTVCIGKLCIPTYSLIVLIGINVCCCIAFVISRVRKDNYSSFLFVTICGGVAAFLGAKVLPGDGYSYFGGLAAFLFVFWLVCRIKGYDTGIYERHYAFLLPLLHVFWKIACFMGGCCFGVPYSGPCAVIFPDGINSLSGTPVFPVQLLEALGALIILLIMTIYNEKFISPLSGFLIMYGIERFLIEFLRYNSEKAWLSEGQVYSVLCIFSGIVIYKNISKSRGEFINEKTK